jgi:hypothetical protein
MLTVTIEMPLRDSLLTKSSSGISLTTSSIGADTSSSTRSAAAPGKYGHLLVLLE